MCVPVTFLCANGLLKKSALQDICKCSPYMNLAVKWWIPTFSACVPLKHDKLVLVTPHHMLTFYCTFYFKYDKKNVLCVFIT